MSKTTTIDYNTTLKYSGYGALLSFVVMILLLVSGNSPWSSASWMGCWIPGVTAYFVLKIYHQNNSVVSYGNSLRRSMMVIFFQALFYTLAAIIFSLVVNTGAVDLYQTEMMANAAQLQTMMGEEMFTQLAKELENLSFSTLAFWDFIYKLIGGFIVSLILASIFRKNNPIFENE
ncbi:MAG: DUF4199 domain-containing protein [Flavobacteriales bacterium]|nr:DUF4199 domain-containing protein [Flavobacteriales bacterium]MCB0409081.1 DUF4199 domain-containing protein [Flavobacteriales bacterium]